MYLNSLLCIFPERTYLLARVLSKMKTLPNGKILNTQTLGNVVRQQRKQQGATQVEFASLCGVGVRFISDLENGKATIELGKVLQVLNSLGLEMAIQPRGWTHSDTAIDASGGPS